jgi:hypothetical protein
MGIGVEEDRHAENRKIQFEEGSSSGNKEEQRFRMLVSGS